MSVFKPNKSPYYWYDFRVKGRRFYGSTGTKNKDAARDIEAARRAEVIRSEFYPDSTDMSLDQAAGLYWDQKAKHQPSASTTDYQLTNLLRLLGKDTMLTTLTDATVAEMISRRRGERSRHAIKAHGMSCHCSRCLVSPATVNREVELLRRVLYRARDVYEVSVPSLKWKDHRLVEADPRDRHLSPDEEFRLIATAAPHLRPAIRFSILTGLRLGNVLGLDWSQIDLRSREIRLRVKSRKPGGKVHILPVTAEILVLLSNLGPRDKGRVFLYKGRPIKSWRTAFKAALRRAGIEDFRWHDLRHTAGTRMVQLGADISVVQKVLGHADIATTLRYLHHATDDKRRAMELLSQRDPKPAAAEDDN